MKIAGIVAEYNPFHTGHAHLIDRTRAPEEGCGATHIVAVMSGNFVQRGEPAVLPKAARVRSALAGGVDLVLELPLPWALSSAEGFAYGAVSLLHSLGCVDALSFGSECGDLALLEQAADALEHPRFFSLLAYHLEGGIPFPQARQRAVAELRNEQVAALFAEANNTLGIEYIKALRQLASPMQPFTVRRLGAGHDARLPVGDMASASFLREAIRADRLMAALAYMPAACADILSQTARDGHLPAQISRIERALLARLRTMSVQEMAQLPDVTEGLENRLYRAAREAESYEQLLEQVKTKRYPLTRIQRLVWSAFLGVQETDSRERYPDGLAWRQPPYVRVLGANDKGLDILRLAKKSSAFLFSRSAQADQLDPWGQRIWALENRAADLYALALPRPYPCGLEHTTGWIREN